MADGTKIEWTDATWNPITGCSVHSAGCTNCYAMKLAGTRLQHHDSRKGLTVDTKAGPVWTGEVRFNEGWLIEPLRWKRPRRVFVVAHGDLFHEAVPDEWIDRVFAVMALCPQHQFQVLTKRADRMRAYLTNALTDSHLLDGRLQRIQDAAYRTMAAIDGRWDEARAMAAREAVIAALLRIDDRTNAGFANVWLGVSVEDQRAADERIPHLLATPAAVRWVSAEPLLGPVDLTDHCNGHFFQNFLNGARWHDAPEGEFGASDRNGGKLDWIVVGGESGDGARPMHPDWVRSLRDQCAAAGVPFLFKQWGAWGRAAVRPSETPGNYAIALRPSGIVVETDHYPRQFALFGGSSVLERLGKKAAGRLLDGQQHDGFPA